MVSFTVTERQQKRRVKERNWAFALCLTLISVLVLVVCFTYTQLPEQEESTTLKLEKTLVVWGWRPSANSADATQHTQTQQQPVVGQEIQEQQSGLDAKAEPSQSIASAADAPQTEQAVGQDQQRLGAKADATQTQQHTQTQQQHIHTQQSAPVEQESPEQQQSRIEAIAVRGDVDGQPLSEADVERIVAEYPYVEDCEICRACVPTHLLAHHPKARARLKSRGLRTVQTSDPDIILEVEDEQGGQQQQGNSGGASLWGSASQPRKRGLIQSRPTRATTNGIYNVKGVQLDLSALAPGNVLAKRSHLPRCPICWGCSHTLHSLAKGTTFNGSHYKHESGGTASWLFRVASNRTRSGQAVVKIACVPVKKPGQSIATCQPSNIYAQIKLLLAQHKLTTECGLSDIVPKLWVAPVNGVVPDHGFHINWLGLWAEPADGVSLENILMSGRPHMSQDAMLNLFQNKLNHTELKLAALFDLFTSQCDRHPQNYFLNEHGKLWAIDNDQVYSTCWRSSALDSLVLPTTQKHMIQHLGGGWVGKSPNADWKKEWSIVSLMNYRCHVTNGTIGFDFPPKMRQCMSRLSAISPANIAEQYGFPILRLATAYKQRSEALLTHGFEWTLKYGEPLNPPALRYKMSSTCCKMDFKPNTKSLICVDPNVASQNKMTQLPLGDPSLGGAWHGKGPDPGSYVGGTEF